MLPTTEIIRKIYLKYSFELNPLLDTFDKKSSEKNTKKQREKIFVLLQFEQKTICFITKIVRNKQQPFGIILKIYMTRKRVLKIDFKFYI